MFNNHSNSTSEITGSLSYLASLSSEVQDISDSLMKNVEQSQVEKLQVRVKELTGHVARLQLQLAETETEVKTLNEAQVSSLLATISADAAAASIINLTSTYNAHFFMELEPETRLLVATRLIDIFHTRKSNPPALWQTIVVRQGFN